MKSLTKEERNTLYRSALNEHKRRKSLGFTGFLCDCLMSESKKHGVLFNDYYEMINSLPEFKPFRRKGLKKLDGWFNTSFQRINCMETCIELTK